MSASTLLFALLALSVIAYAFGRRRAIGLVDGEIRRLQSLPAYYGLYVAMWCGIPALIALAVWSAVDHSVITQVVTAGLPEHLLTAGPDRLNLLVNDIRNHVAGNVTSSQLGPEMIAATERYAHLLFVSKVLKTIVVLSIALGLMAVMLRRLHAGQRTRTLVEGAIEWGLILCSSVAILTTIGIVLSVLFESLRFFGKVPISEFLFGLEWSPQIALRADQVGSSGSFGAIPLFVGTMLISLIAMLVAVPIGLMSAVYLSEYAPRHVRNWAKPLVEILAGIPTVVYGFFAALTVAPFLRDLGASIGLDVASESALAAGVVMGIMIIPFVSSLSDDVINAVPQSLRDGALGMGATHSETVKRVILPAALPGIVGSILLALSRAVGETMIVVMAAGLAANLTANPLETVTTVTVQIVTLLVGDQEFDSAKTLAAFALGLMLFIVTLVLNVIALHIVRKYREQYE
ncbi:MAG: phosphate ABC transporter permease subunit PstC [Burkholderiaceae bacterium]